MYIYVCVRVCVNPTSRRKHVCTVIRSTTERINYWGMHYCSSQRNRLAVIG